MTQTESKKLWSEQEDDDQIENQELERTETPPDENGVKTITEIKYDKNTGKKIKITRKVKVVKKEKKVNKKAQERKKWKKFGIAASTGDEKVKSAQEEIVHFEPAKKEQEASEELLIIDKMKSDLMSKVSNIEKPKEVAPVTKPTETPKQPAAGKYVLPIFKKDSSSSVKTEREEKRVVKVSNISEQITDRDLTILFGKAGYVAKTSLVKDRITKVSKGFAFITYERTEDAEKAITLFNAKPLDHLILNVEFAQSRDD